MTSALLFTDDTAGGLDAATAQEHLLAAGVQVLAVLVDCRNLVQAVQTHAPDVVVVHAASPQEALFQAAEALAEQAPRPLLVFTTDPDPQHAERAVAAGMHGYEVGAYSAARLPALVQLCRARFRHEQGLRSELRELGQRFEERKLVERAKGVLMQARQLSDDAAFEMLRNAAMHSGQRLGQVSGHILHSARFADGVNRAGQLRMLSQRLVKLYLLRLALGRQRVHAVRLAESVQRIDDNLAVLNKHLARPTFDAWLLPVELTWTQLKKRLQGPPKAADVAEVDRLAERLLQEAEQLTLGLQQAGSAAPLRVLNLAGRQRMLSQRFAKLALLGFLGGSGWQAGAPALDAVRTEFETGLKDLQGLPLTSADIRQDLVLAAQGWQQMLNGVAFALPLATQDRLDRAEGLAQASENLLDVFEQLATQYERSMQMLLG